MKKAKYLLNMTTSLLHEGHPDLEGSLEGLSRVFAKIIFARRLQCGYSQQELADKADVDLKIIFRSEGGFDNLSIGTYDKIFRALDLGIRDVAEAMIQLKASGEGLAST